MSARPPPRSTRSLQASVTVPDHGTLRPWRLVVVEGDARNAFGEALAAAGREANPDVPDDLAERLCSKAFAAPTLIAVVARIDPDAKIAVWEQVAAAACAGYATTLAAHQLGVRAIWKSTPDQEGETLRHALDIGSADQFLGWVNLDQIPVERPTSSRPAVDLTPIVRQLGADGLARVAGCDCRTTPFS